jgi:uncharacterized protein
MLVEHDVMLAVSLDGPEEEHDRLRIDAQGRGTFGRIAENLRRLKAEHPDYWANRVTSVSVYDWGSDVEAAERFFAGNADLMPRTVFVNQVSSRNTGWYGRYTGDERGQLAASLARLRDQYKQAKIGGAAASHYLNSLIGMPVSLMLLRRRLLDQRPAFLPFSGACVPGDKVAVHVDGKIDMCERVNGTYPIGYLDAGGIDYGRVRELIGRYQRQVLYKCPECPATRLCGVCFSFVEGDGDFARAADVCAATIEGAKQRLADYVSILEENPGADFAYETATARLEERLLFDY